MKIEFTMPVIYKGKKLLAKATALQISYGVLVEIHQDSLCGISSFALNEKVDLSVDDLYGIVASQDLINKALKSLDEAIEQYQVDDLDGTMF